MDLKKLTELFYVQSISSRVLSPPEDADIHWEYSPVRPYMRPSSMPVCSVLKTLEIMQWKPWRPLPTSMDFYVTCGTAVHSWAQRVAARSGRLLGHWNCEHCTTGEKGTAEEKAANVLKGTRKEMTTDSYCDVCEYAMVYEELTVEYRGMKGHVDSLFVGMLPTKGHIHLTDYKTTSLRMAGYKEKNHSIDPKYIVQLCTYAFVLREVYKLRIGKISLLYVPRDNFNERLEFALDWTPELHEETRVFVDAQIDAFDLAKKAAESDDPIEYIDEILAHKACRDKAHYKEFMAEIFHYDGGCQFKDECFTSRMPRIFEQQIRFIQDATKGEEHEPNTQRL